jgi:hypothetical protein
VEAVVRHGCADELAAAADGLRPRLIGKAFIRDEKQREQEGKAESD